MFDAAALVSYGGPEKLDEIDPFLDAVLAGKRVPPARRAAVAERYARFGGVSPGPGECRRFVETFERIVAENASDVASAIDDAAKTAVSTNVDAPFRPAPRLYWGNMYAAPTLDDAFAQIESDGVRNLLVFPATAFGAPQSCRRYVDAVRAAVARRSPEFASRTTIASTPPFFDLPAFRRCVADSLLTTLAWDELDAEPFADANANVVSSAAFDVERRKAPDSRRLLLFSAHSIPLVDALNSAYPAQLISAASNVARSILDAPGFGGSTVDAARRKAGDVETTRAFPNRPIVLPAPFDVDFAGRNDFSNFLATNDADSASVVDFSPELRKRLLAVGLDAVLAFQSRSGSPATPWIGPSVADAVRRYKAQNPTWRRLVVAPLGFLFDNFETIFDLDVELRGVCDELGVSYRRAPCVGTSERLIRALVDLTRKSPSDFPVCRLSPGKCDLSCRRRRETQNR